jgi:hypothetical protein
MVEKLIIRESKINDLKFNELNTYIEGKKQ